jgi:hypothetical protein
MTRLRALLLAPLSLAACTVSTEPVMTLSVTGTITREDAPAPAIVTLTAGNHETSIAFSDGTYSITVGGGVIPESACASAAISAQILAEDEGSDLEEQTRQIGTCGAHVVDFEFP